jgi:hypothetical protein
MRRSALLLAVFLALTGCYTYAPVEVHVVDAATKQPLPGVTVHGDHHRFIELFPPKMEPSVTDANGVAMLSVCTNYKADLTVGTLFIKAAPFPDRSAWGAMVEVPVDAIRKAGGSPYRVDLAIDKSRAEDIERQFRAPGGTGG